jgi:dinuclear metal center YbgI/SA1388 family protein
MGIHKDELVSYLQELYDSKNFQDYGPNGLQIDGKDEISKIAYAVSATRESVEKAVQLEADALIVHHGLFWKFHGPKAIIPPFSHRVKPLIKNDINLIGFHLPMDAHIPYGNAYAIGDQLKLEAIEPFGDYKGCPTGISGKLKKPIPADELKKSIQKILNHDVIHSSPNDQALISSIGIITGGANGDWVMAKAKGLDAYLTGEISEHDWHEAKEAGIHFYAGGHNATEQFGVQYLLKHLHEKLSDRGVEHFFIPSHNPA